MSDNPVVLHRHHHARGNRVAGVDGRLYHVAPTGQLHAVDGGIVSPVPGCHPDCAARFALFPDTFRRLRPTPPPPPSPSPSAPPTEEVEVTGGPAFPVSAADLSILDGSVKSLRDALDSGNHDDHLDALLAAEESGKTRKSAVNAIRDRIDGLED